MDQQRPEPQPNTAWRHANGNTYRVLCVATEHQSFRRLVVYIDGEGHTWARTLERFLERFAPATTHLGEAA